MDRGAWETIVHGVSKSWTRLSDCHSIMANKAPFPKVETILHTSGRPEDVAPRQAFRIAKASLSPSTV